MHTRTQRTEKNGLLVILTLSIAALLVTSFLNLTYQENGAHFIELAQSFMNGRLDLMFSGPDRGDVVPIDGKAYWPLGPFPAIALMPIVGLIGDRMTIGLMAFPLILLTGFFIIRIAKQIGFTHPDSLWLTFAFLFASPYVTVAWVPRSWQFAHIIAVVLMFAALYEHLTRKRLWLIGLVYAGIIATRIPAGFTLLFFVLDILWHHRKTIPAALRNLAQLLLFPILSVVLLLLYNYLRFGLPFEFGYALANLGPDLVRMRSYGVLSLTHIPGNLFYFLFAGPQPVTESLGHVFRAPFIKTDMWGLGLIYAAPYYFSLLWKRFTDQTNKILWITIIVAAIPVLTYFSLGPFQQAFRYSLDFLPLLFMIFMRSIYLTDKKLDVSFKILITLTFFLHLHLFLGALL